MQNPFKATGKTPHFEYAFSYFQQMARDAVDGRTINVVLQSSFFFLAFLLFLGQQFYSLLSLSALKYLNFSLHILTLHSKRPVKTFRF